MQKSNGYKEEWESSEEVAEQILKEPNSRFLTSGHNDDQACVSGKTTSKAESGGRWSALSDDIDHPRAFLEALLGHMGCHRVQGL